MKLYRVATDEQELKVGTVRRGYIALALNAADAAAKVNKLDPCHIEVVNVEALEKDIVCYQTQRLRDVTDLS